MFQCITTPTERQYFLMLTQNAPYFSFCPLCLILLHLKVWFCLLYTFPAVFIYTLITLSFLFSPAQDLSGFPCTRDISLTKSPPGPFCGLGACLHCGREHKPGPSTHDAFHQYQSPSCPNMFGNGFQIYLLHHFLRD